jgi:broad specificity phosphatase PhoE
MNMITILLCRHGKTESNTNSVTMGQIDSPLTEEGLDNAKHIGEILKNKHIDKIYSSDLGRAFMTAYFIQKINTKEIEIIPRKELREINYGDFANKDKIQVKQDCKHYKTKVDYIFPNGESYQQVQDRVINFIDKLEQENKINHNKIQTLTNKAFDKGLGISDSSTVLIVTHSGAIRAINTYYKKQDFQENLKTKVGHEYVGKFEIENNKLIKYEELN